MKAAHPPKARMGRLLVIATLGLSAAALPARYQEPCAEDVQECATRDAERRQAAPATAQDRLSYLFWD